MNQPEIFSLLDTNASRALVGRCFERGLIIRGTLIPNEHNSSGYRNQTSLIDRRNTGNEYDIGRVGHTVNRKIGDDQIANAGVGSA